MKHIFIKLVLLSAFANTILRPSIESDITLYRILAPVFCVYIFFVMPTLTIKTIGWYILFLIYSTVLAFNYSNDFTQFIPSLIHYAFIFITFLIMQRYKQVSGARFEGDYYTFMKGLIIFLLAFSVFEYISGNPLPNIKPDVGISQAFFWNTNDLAIVLCAFAWLLLFRSNEPMYSKILFISMFAAILVLNGAKSALLGLLLVLSLRYGHLVAARIKMGQLLCIVFVVFIIGGVTAVFAVYGDTKFATWQGEFTLNGILIDPIVGILTLTPSGEFWGSIQNRMDASIFVLIEYIRSTAGFGLGPGGSWLVLTLPQYELGGAKSPHNALLQLIVDFGYPVLFGYLYLAARAIKALFSKHTVALDRARSTAILSFPILGLTQSGAIVTNYTFLSVCFFLCLASRERF